MAEKKSVGERSLRLSFFSFTSWIILSGESARTNLRNSISAPKIDAISRAGNQAHFRNENIELHGRALSDALMRAGALLAR